MQRVLLFSGTIVVLVLLSSTGVYADVITPTNTIILTDSGSNAVDYYGSAIVVFILLCSFCLGFWLGSTGIRLE